MFIVTVKSKVKVKVMVKIKRGRQSCVYCTYLHEDDVGACFCKADRDGLADAARAARDHGFLAMQREKGSTHGNVFELQFCGEGVRSVLLRDGS